ncbi:methionine--tRNA ligase [Novosphingobium sp. Gsoil 351]|uniref:methionine--tRNA ligase n=1 Tax=Novosphingobium sp. Gsoil 351 TaxID=2675225 RepID=UPI0012B4B729|nr:methionine--tRNA ligase [Novosphingobium sp. Gsoil 351]QGN53345.1 methionine--tRNA ligase [Novosphingobium sp. Gsoil 351]
MADPYYITTAIAYPNGKPHIGHAYEAIAADAIARFQRMRGRDVRLVTGTDEHGLKMAQTARDAGRDTLEFATEMSNYFRGMCDALNISYDDFCRTTEPRHHDASVAIWKALEAAGDLYLDRYEGWYSVRDEAFYDESELIDGEGGLRLSPQGTPVEWTVEESWFFRLSKYRDYLIELNESAGFLEPESRRNEVLAFLKGQDLRDLSVSRTSFAWGVPVPGSAGHVMYVWVDALTTYLTGIGFPGREGDFARFWPANVHLIGKDIVRFHAVYWPAILKSAGLPSPRAIFGHGFLLHRGEKMSKSLGNVVDPLELAERFGVDQLRYFLLREVTFGQDGSYSADAIVTRCNAELANSFGNLAQRTLSLIFKNCDAFLPEISGHAGEDTELLEFVGRITSQDLPDAFDKLALSQGIESWMSAVFACNAYIDAQAPWSLRKTDPQRMRTVLATLYIAIGQLAVAITPVIPQSAVRLLEAMGIAPELRMFAAIRSHWYSPLAESGFRLEQPVGLFPRLALPVEAV